MFTIHLFFINELRSSVKFAILCKRKCKPGKKNCQKLLNKIVLVIVVLVKIPVLFQSRSKLTVLKCLLLSFEVSHCRNSQNDAIFELPIMSIKILKSIEVKRRHNFL